MRKTAVIFLFLSLLFPNAESHIPPEQKEKPLLQQKDIPSIEKILFECVNSERKKRNLPELQYSNKLSLLARSHSQEMAQTKHLSHLSSTGKTYRVRINEAGFYYISAGENVARSETFVSQIIHEELIKSPEHRKNILNPSFNRLGIGISLGKDKQYYITQDFLQSLKIRDREEVKQEIKQSINRLRAKNILPQLEFLEQTSEYADRFAIKKAEKKPPPSLTHRLSSMEAHIYFLASPSLAKVYDEFKDLVIKKQYESASVGVHFARNSEYPGGAYFVILILFPVSEYKNLTEAELREIVLKAMNKIRKKHKLKMLHLDMKLSKEAGRISNGISLSQSHYYDFIDHLHRRQQQSILSYFTENLSILPGTLSEKLGKDMIPSDKVGIGIHFRKNKKYPAGVYLVTLLF